MLSNILFLSASAKDSRCATSKPVGLWSSGCRVEQEEVAASEMDLRPNGGYRNATDRALTLRANTVPKRYSTKRTSTSKVRFGEATDDVHICIMCLRAIMNHQVKSTFDRWLDPDILFDHKPQGQGRSWSINRSMHVVRSITIRSKLKLNDQSINIYVVRS